MPTWDVLIAFFGVAVLLGLSPGPDNLFVLVQSAQRGWRVGLCVVLGLSLGIVGHTVAVPWGWRQWLLHRPCCLRRSSFAVRPTWRIWHGVRGVHRSV